MPRITNSIARPSISAPQPTNSTPAFTLPLWGANLPSASVTMQSTPRPGPSHAELLANKAVRSHAASHGTSRRHETRGTATKMRKGQWRCYHAACASKGWFSAKTCQTRHAKIHSTAKVTDAHCPTCHADFHGRMDAVYRHVVNSREAGNACTVHAPNCWKGLREDGIPKGDRAPLCDCEGAYKAPKAVKAVKAAVEDIDEEYDEEEEYEQDDVPYHSVASSSSSTSTPPLPDYLTPYVDPVLFPLWGPSQDHVNAHGQFSYPQQQQQQYAPQQEQYQPHQYAGQQYEPERQYAPQQEQYQPHQYAGQQFEPQQQFYPAQQYPAQQQQAAWGPSSSSVPFNDGSAYGAPAPSFTNPFAVAQPGNWDHLDGLYSMPENDLFEGGGGSDAVHVPGPFDDILKPSGQQLSQPLGQAHGNLNFLGF